MRAFLRSLIVIALPLLVLTGCGKNYNWRQKLTVEVETPEGLKTASSVMSVKFTDSTQAEWAPPDARNVFYNLSGEAVVLEVAPGKYLFALLRQLPYAPRIFFPDRPQEETAPLLLDMRETRELQPKQYPLLVTFDDINNPASVKRVNPANLEATFGPGYRLNGITLSLTNEPMTKGEVEKVVGWWGNKKLFERLWPSLSDEQHQMLSSANWIYY